MLGEKQYSLLITTILNLKNYLLIETKKYNEIVTKNI